MTINKVFIHWFCLMFCCVVLVGCIGRSIDKTVATFEEAISMIDRNSKSWQTTIKKLEQDLVAQGQSTLANEVQSLSNRTIARSGVELRCNEEFIAQRVNQGLRRILARRRKQPVPPLTPAFCSVDPEEIKIEQIRQGRLTSLNYYGYDMFDRNASDSPMRVFLLDKLGGEQDITFAMALPTHYLMTVRLADYRVKITDQADKLIIRWGKDRDSFSIINFIPPQTQPTPIVVNGLQVTFHTNDDNKDDNTGVSVTIQNVTEWHQVQDEEFQDGSDIIKSLNPSSVQLTQLTGNTLEICIWPTGNDTWRFNMTFSGTRSDGIRYFYSANSIKLNQDIRCKEWNLP